ncbi:class I SAM-dependent methyltransferase [Sporosarcina koreensis]|uniref:class I SAM-dependent methyltransferase n=1 Tax=Sporosarcina koreensis TaxID=334735 RepID=UPI00058CB1F9|nr:class I SAM-dependent methyltransferase [Sporosarcina koreensis]
MNKWQTRFDTDEYVFGKEPNEFIREAAKLYNPGPDILAIAEGEGRNAVYLAGHGNQVTIWDFAESGLAKAQQLAKENGVQLATELKDLAEAAWPENQYDAVICVFGHFPPELRARVLEGVRTAVKPGGLFITEVYAKEQLAYGTGGPKEEDYLYSLADFDVFREWETLRLEQKEVERHEGTGHNGLSCVIQYAGRK